MNYYNEFDPKAAAWLLELIKAGAIPAGDVDTRSICDVQPSDLEGYTQCHFFAGIGGWSYALQLAGWPSDNPVWTGSCPCQPYSTAGKQLGDKDERNLWPQFFRLIRERRPERVFGEQVASAIGHGWLDGISSDLEAEGYACGACVLGAHSVGAPHIRKRLYWMANAKRRTAELQRFELGESESGVQREARERQRIWNDAWDGVNIGGLGNSERSRLEALQCVCIGAEAGQEQSENSSSHVRLGHSHQPGSQGRNGEELRECSHQQAAGAGSAWSDFQLIPCRDGRSRRSQSGIFPLAHGFPARVVRLRGYGNAICPQTAQAFIEACIDIFP